MAEYLHERYPQGGYTQRIPLGPVVAAPAAGETLAHALARSRPWRPEVDALVQEAQRVVLIEAKLFKLVDGLAKLPLYKSLVASTPELAGIAGRPVVMRLVAPWSNTNAEAMARAAGIEIDVFAPAWVVEYVERYHQYWTAESRQARAERQEMRERFGLE